MGKKQFLGLVFMMLLLAAAGFAQITVLGTNTYPADVNNVQAAVMISNTTVYLSGTFNFGPDGSVLINVPNVTLEGAAAGATIMGGKNPITTYDGTLPSGARNVSIRNIHFVGWNESAILVKGVSAEDTNTLIEGNTFDNTMSPVPYGGFGGINYCLCAGSVEIKNNTLSDFSYPSISVRELTLHADDHVLIEGNAFINSTWCTVEVELWDPWGGDLDNGPVIIRNNEINLNHMYAWGVGIGGDYYLGASNVVVEGNVIAGYGDAGITAWCYGHNRKIINNDLTGLMSTEPNIFDCGRGDLIAGNVLGTTDTEIGFVDAVAIWLTSANPSAWGFALPDSLPVTNNVIRDNDFRQTGLKGWAFDASGNFTSMGCVLLASWADFGFAPPWSGADITNNLVNETGLFPRGTGGPKQQVLEFPVYAHDNRIVGHSANEYAQLEAANPGIGQKIKESMANSPLLNRRALFRQK